MNKHANKKINKVVKSILAGSAFAAYFTINFFLLFSINAKAYIDPSATSYMVQAIAFVAIAIGASFTIFRHKIAAFFKKNKGEEETKEVVIKEELDDESDSENN